MKPITAQDLRFLSGADRRGAALVARDWLDDTTPTDRRSSCRDILHAVRFSHEREAEELASRVFRLWNDA